MNEYLQELTQQLAEEEEEDKMLEVTEEDMKREMDEQR